MTLAAIGFLEQIRALSKGSLDQLSIKSKLILMLLLASGLSTLLTALLGYRGGQINLSGRVFNQLTSILASKAYQVESYFRAIQNHTQILSEALSIVAAVQGNQQWRKDGLGDSGEAILVGNDSLMRLASRFGPALDEYLGPDLGPDAARRASRSSHPLVRPHS